MTQDTNNQFDVAAAKAEEELNQLKKNLDAKTVAELAAWWKRNFMAAGHKRLGRIIAKMG